MTSLGRLPIETFPKSGCPGSPSGGRMSEVPQGHREGERCGEKKLSTIVLQLKSDIKLRWLLVAHLLPQVMQPPKNPLDAC